ncbi:hypothetical protein [Thermomonospora amylolytica]|uniref:hypothetical protein n=1 Tax=Thermomonospora amylolytica TaxID=1411117 RepID=UPI000E6C031A|nr:hypothetical protein [Thermomonospora amylolytica]
MHDGPAPLGRLSELAGHPGTALADLLLDRVTAADVQRLLQNCPRPFLRTVLGQVGLPDVKRISDRTAEVVLRTLRGGEPRRRRALREILGAGYEHHFGNPDGLTADDCRALLDSGRAAVTLDKASILAAGLAWEGPLSLQRWGLARVVELDLPLAPVALGLLAGEADALGEAGPHAVSAWRALRERHPGLPEDPIGFTRLRELARQRPAAPSTGDEENDVTTGTTPAEPSVSAVAAALEELRERLPVAADAADRVAAALHTGRRPDAEEMRLVTEVVTAFDTVRDRIIALVPGAEPMTDLQMLSAALETVRQADAKAARIRALAGIQGPRVVADELAEVRRMARTGTGDGLDVLAELIEVTCGPDDELRAPALAQQARELLPESCRRLVDVALMGKLAVVPPQAGSPEDPDEEDDGGTDPDAEPGSPGPSGGTEAEPPPPDDLAGTLSAHRSDAADPAPGRAEGNPPPEATADAGPGSERASTEPVAEAARADRPEADDLADLDALIAETFPAPRPASEIRRAIAGVGDARAAVNEPSAKEPVRPTAGDEAVRDEAAAEEDAGAAPVELEPRILEAEAAALRAGRFGLAGRLRSAAGRPAAEEAARRCAAIATEMARFAGPLSAEFAAAARGVGLRSLSQDPAGALLVWAAAIRAGLVHPTPESTRLLEEMTIVVSDHRVLVDCGDAFAHAARSGAYLGPGVAGRTRGTAEATLLRRQAALEASRLLEEEPHRKIKYQRATEVWKRLLQRQEPVGALLALAAQDDPALADQAAERLTRLRSGDEIDRLIDENARAIAARRQSKKIIAGARAQLVTKVGNALDTVAQWVRAVKEEAADRDAADAQDWRLGLLGQLQESVGQRRPLIVAALEERAVNAPDEVQAAAAEAARDLLMKSLDLLDGAPLPETEPPVAHAVDRHLLLAPAVSVDPVSFEPFEPPTVEQLIPVAFTADDAWRTAFERRAERGDHEGTHGIITVLERRDPQAAAALRERETVLISKAREARDARIEETRDLVARWARDGALTEHEVRRSEELLSSLTGDRRDFDRIDRSLDELRERLEEWRRGGIARERARLERRAAEDTRIAAVQDRIAERIDQGDLTLAREYLAQLEAGEDLPRNNEGVDHLGRFYPGFCSAFAGAVRSGGRVGRHGDYEHLTPLKDALRVGRDVEHPGLAAALREAGIDIPALRLARREESHEGIRQWQACGRGHKTPGNLRSTITAVLRMLGLEGVQREVPGTPDGRDRIWVDLEVEQVVGEALLPAFGSRMSPSGDRLRLLLVWRRPGPQQLIEMLKGQPEDQTVLVWYFGVLPPEERQQLATAARRRPAPVAGVLDDAAISYLACMPEADWATAVAVMAPFTATNPYAPVGDVPDEMFYGRADQLREVTDRTGSSFVYGGRQLGKSALLRKAERHIRATDPDRTVILENVQNIGKVVPLHSLWSKLADKLAQAGVLPGGLAMREEVCDGVRAWVEGDPRRQVLILLDEADHFLNQDADGARFDNVIALRDLMQQTGNRVKVVFAGLHQTARFQSLTNQPLAHLGEPIAVGPLEPQNAFDLLVRPLATLGFRFPEQLAARVIAEANNAPALVQLFAEELLKRLRRSSRAARQIPYEITAEDVAEVWRDKALARGFRDRFEWTLNLDKRYKVIAYTVALHALTEGAAATLGVGELWEQCRYWWKEGFEDCTSDGFRSLLDECVNLGVLGLDVDGYRLRTPHILNLLGGTAEVEEVLENAVEFEQPDSFDAHSYRGIYGDGPERSPLSSRQLATLFRPHDLVHVVTGSRALHEERVAHALEAEQTGHPGVRVLRVCNDGLTFEGALHRAENHDGHTVIVVRVPEGKTRQQFDRRLRQALDAVAGQHRGTLAVVLVTGVHLACTWRNLPSHDGVDLVELRRFDRPAIRQWMWEESYGFTDEKGQEDLLACTGGWPTLIGQVVTRIAGHGGDRDEALEHCREYLRRSPGQFVADTGVLADPCLEAAWRLLVKENAPDTPEDLAALLELHGQPGEERIPGLGPRSLTEHGYGSAADLVEALRLLGALEPGEGRLACEPVLAEATRRMTEAR